MRTEDLNKVLEKNLDEAHYEVLIWPALIIAVAVLAWFIRLYLTEWRERKHPFWERERRRRITKK